MKYRLIATDMDNTVLNHGEKTITPRTLAALKAATAQGCEVVFASGRSFAEARKFYALLPELRYYIGDTGASLLDVKTGVFLRSAALGRATAERVLQAVAGMDYMLNIHAGTELYVQENRRDKLERYGTEMYRELFRESGTPVEDTDAVLLKLADSAYKADFFFTSPQAAGQARERLAALGVSTSSGTETNVEVMAAGSTKGSTLRALCERLGIGREEVIACGDADNDISMVTAAGLGVAVGNAAEELKRVAKVIAPDCDHDGVGRIIEEYILK